MNRLLILAEDAEKYAHLVHAVDLEQLQIGQTDDLESAISQIVDANIVLGDPPLIGEVLSTAGCLQWVQSSWAGVDQLCQPQLRRDYVLTGMKDVFGPMISEHVMTYLFALERRLFEMRANQVEKIWEPFTYRSSEDIVLGIIGLGSIGQHLAKTARQFGIRVTGLNLSGKPCAEVEQVFSWASMADFLAEPDYVVITLPDTPQTRHCINAEVLGMMKPVAVLINVGRGSVVNENDLIVALRQNTIGGAVLDVFECEPLSADNPLWHLPNVYITPHTAAVSLPEVVVKKFVANYHRFLRQEPLLDVIDFVHGY